MAIVNTAAVLFFIIFIISMAIEVNIMLAITPGLFAMIL